MRTYEEKKKKERKKKKRWCGHSAWTTVGKSLIWALIDVWVLNF